MKSAIGVEKDKKTKQITKRLTREDHPEVSN